MQEISIFKITYMRPLPKFVLDVADQRQMKLK